LVAQLVRFSGNVGRSVGVLYFVNTLGSAVACFAAALITMRYLGMSGSIAVAVLLNVLVASVVLALHFRWRTSRTAASPTIAEKTLPAGLRFSSALIHAAMAGFISLIYEIVWYRVYSFASGGPAQSFSYVLGAFLAGIAFG